MKDSVRLNLSRLTTNDIYIIAKELHERNQTGTMNSDSFTNMLYLDFEKDSLRTIGRSLGFSVFQDFLYKEIMRRFIIQNE